MQLTCNINILTTLALILDGSDRTLCPPVHHRRKCIKAHILIPEFCWNLHLVGNEPLVSLGRPELIIAEIRKLVDAESELAVSGVE